jgi:hypothetical protein
MRRLERLEKKVAEQAYDSVSSAMYDFKISIQIFM